MDPLLYSLLNGMLLQNLPNEIVMPLLLTSSVLFTMAPFGGSLIGVKDVRTKLTQFIDLARTCDSECLKYSSLRVRSTGIDMESGKELNSAPMS